MSDRPTTSVLQLIYDRETNELRTSTYNASREEALLMVQQFATKLTMDLIQGKAALEESVEGALNGDKEGVPS